MLIEKHYPFEHAMAEIRPGIRIHVVTAGNPNAKPVVLLHGFPQTWWCWRHIMADLASAGLFAIAVDYRGAGSSSKPKDGYDKMTMAEDVRMVVRHHLAISANIALVGHDIGLMVAFAYAAQFRDEASHLIVLDAPLPGTKVFDRLRIDPRIWHFSFHSASDVPELLLHRRERPYLRHMFDTRLYDPSALSRDDFETYVAAYSAPGAMRAGLELYRAFDQDVVANRKNLERNGPLQVPVLAIGGAISTSGPHMLEMMREVASDVSGEIAPNTGHWISEENPQFVAYKLKRFLQPNAQ